MNCRPIHDISQPTATPCSLHRFIGGTGYQLDDLRTDLRRLAFLLGHDDGASLFGHDQP